MCAFTFSFCPYQCTFLPRRESQISEFQDIVLRQRAVIGDLNREAAVASAAQTLVTDSLQAAKASASGTGSPRASVTLPASSCLSHRFQDGRVRLGPALRARVCVCVSVCVCCVCVRVCVCALLLHFLCWLLTCAGQKLTGIDLRLQQELILKYEELLRFKEAEAANDLRELQARNY